MLNFYSDASLNPKLGMGGVYMDRFWFHAKWNEQFIIEEKPSIEFLELYALVVAVLIWGKRQELCNRTIAIFCDNESMKSMVNKLVSGCPKCMKLIRILALDSIHHNSKIKVLHVKSELNTLADALSRMKIGTFWDNAPETMQKFPCLILEYIWPPEKIWFN